MDIRICIATCLLYFIVKLNNIFLGASCFVTNLILKDWNSVYFFYKKITGCTYSFFHIHRFYLSIILRGYLYKSLDTRRYFNLWFSPMTKHLGTFTKNQHEKFHHRPSHLLNIFITRKKNMHHLLVVKHQHYQNSVTKLMFIWWKAISRKSRKGWCRARCRGWQTVRLYTSYCAKESIQPDWSTNKSSTNWLVYD